MKIYENLTVNECTNELFLSKKDIPLTKKNKFKSLLKNVKDNLFHIVALIVLTSLFGLFVFLIMSFDYQYKKEIEISQNKFNSVLISEVISNKDLEKIKKNLLINPITKDYNNNIYLSNSHSLIFVYRGKIIAVIKEKNEDSSIMSKVKIKVSPENMVLLQEQIKSLKLSNSEYKIIENKYDSKLNTLTFSFIDKNN